MRLLELFLIERSSIRDLIEKVSDDIPKTIATFIHKSMFMWERNATRDRRMQLGYDGHYDNVEDWRKKNGLYGNQGPKEAIRPFDAHDFEKQNEKDDWTAQQTVYEKINTLIPKDGNSPVYALMGVVSDSLTKIVRQYVTEIYGDPVYIKQGDVELDLKNVFVQIWWKGATDDYGGVYRGRQEHANGTRTTLEVIVDRNSWRSWLIDAISSHIGADYYHYDEFSESIVRTFAHEYQHFEQDIKGQQSYEFSYIPQRTKGRTTRQGITKGETGIYSDIYYARPAEIDAFAAGSAAQVVERIMRSYRIDAERWHRQGWSIKDIPDDQWNESIRDAIHEYPYDFTYYVSQINDKLKDSPDKAKYLEKVKRRFLKSYTQRLLSYLR